MTNLHSNRSVIQIVLTALGMAGILGIFLPFINRASPASEVFGVLGLFASEALPAFLAVFASAASIRWILSGSLSRLEQAIAYLASAAVVSMFTLLYLDIDSPSGTREWLVLIMPLVLLFSGVFLLIRNSKTGRSKGFNPVMAIQVAYIAYAAFFLIAFFGEWKLGAYCIFIAVVAFSFQIIHISAQSARPSEGSVTHK